MGRWRARWLRWRLRSIRRTVLLRSGNSSNLRNRWHESWWGMLMEVRMGMGIHVQRRAVRVRMTVDWRWWSHVRRLSWPNVWMQHVAWWWNGILSRHHVWRMTSLVNRLVMHLAMLWLGRWSGSSFLLLLDGYTSNDCPHPTFAISLNLLECVMLG